MIIHKVNLMIDPDNKANFVRYVRSGSNPD